MNLPFDGKTVPIAVFGRYEAWAELGRGTTGIVYEGIDRRLGRNVAIKALHRGQIDGNEAQWLAEARRTARLIGSHPNIAQVFDADENDGQYFIVFELVNGTSLDQWVKSHGRPTFDQAAWIAAGIAEGLAYAHRHRVIHRDLKPANIILREDLTPVLVDFGEGLTFLEARAGAPAEIQGTLPYLSPEQARGQMSHINGQTDIFSLGAVLYEMLAGVAPFEDRPAARLGRKRNRTAAENAELRRCLARMHDAPATSVTQLNPAVPRALAKICRKCLELVPDQRYADATELACRLRAYLSQSQVARSASTKTDCDEQVSTERVDHLRPALGTCSKVVSVAHLRTTDASIVGREAERHILDQALVDGGTNLVTIYGWGGIGKSALVNDWLARLATTGFTGIDGVFGWSFDNPTTGNQLTKHSDFFTTAVRYLSNDRINCDSTSDAYRQLLRLLRTKRILLILDGVDGLESASPNAGGELNDRLLAAFLRELAALNRGLCIVTSWFPIKDIAEFIDKTVQVIEVRELPDDASVALLQRLGVRGDDEILRQAARSFRGHALALTLVATYLRDFHNGDCRQYQSIELLAEDERTNGQASRIMRSYEAKLASSDVAFLELLSLAELPASLDEVASLASTPAVFDAIHPSFQAAKRDIWIAIAAGLKQKRLITASEGQAGDRFDLHPLVRAYFLDRAMSSLLNSIEKDPSLLGGRAGSQRHSLLIFLRGLLAPPKQPMSRDSYSF